MDRIRVNKCCFTLDLRTGAYIIVTCSGIIGILSLLFAVLPKTDALGMSI